MSAKTKHTPGPWRVWSSGEYLAVIGKDPVEVAAITLYRNPERHKANANLIAAAPDLLKACNALLTAHGAAIGTEYGNQLLETAIAQAKESVSAATGANKLPDIAALTKARAFLRDSEQSQGHDSGEAIEVIRELAAEIEGMSGYWTEGTANAMQRAEQVAGPLIVDLKTCLERLAAAAARIVEDQDCPAMAHMRELDRCRAAACHLLSGRV